MLIDWTFFAFPLNLFLAAIWAVGWGLLWKNHRECAPIRFLLSPSATISSLILLVAACFWIGLSGNREFAQSIVFIVVLLYVQTVLFLVTLRGWRREGKGIRWRFLLIHAGLLLALGSGFWGSPDSLEMRMYCAQGQTVHEAYLFDGSRQVLDYELTLEHSKAEYCSDGKPVHYEAVVLIDDGKPERITVNHPYNVKYGEDIYLINVSENGCILQIVREPWRYFALAGIVMLLVGAFLLFIKGPRR